MRFIPAILCFIGDLIACKMIWSMVHSQEFFQRVFQQLIKNADSLKALRPELQEVDFTQIDPTPLIAEMQIQVAPLALMGILTLIGGHGIVYFFYTRKARWAESYLSFYSGSAAAILVLSSFVDFKPSSIKFILWALIFGMAFYLDRENKKTRQQPQ